MPQLPGFNLCKALRRATEIAKSEVPVFLLCGGGVGGVGGGGRKDGWKGHMRDMRACILHGAAACTLPCSAEDAAGRGWPITGTRPLSDKLGADTEHVFALLRGALFCMARVSWCSIAQCCACADVCVYTCTRMHACRPHGARVGHAAGHCARAVRHAAGVHQHQRECMRAPCFLAVDKPKPLLCTAPAVCLARASAVAVGSFAACSVPCSA